MEGGFYALQLPERDFVHGSHPCFFIVRVFIVLFKRTREAQSGPDSVASIAASNDPCGVY